MQGEEELIETLRDPLLWQQPDMEGWAAIRAMLEKTAAELAAAGPLCDEVLAGPARWWPQRLRKTDGTRTAGMVHQLLRRVPALLTSDPPGALQATSMALVIADALNPANYPPHHVAQVRAQVLRERAHVLSSLGRHYDALACAERSALAFAVVPAAAFDRARLALVKAVSLRALDCNAEAAQAARDASQVFLRMHDDARYFEALSLEVAALEAAARAPNAPLERPRASHGAVARRTVGGEPLIW